MLGATGGGFTVRMAPVLVMLPAEFVTVTVMTEPFSATAVGVLT